ncbi:hypothetical protein B0J14DRAFT_457953, partial [Halenospora varia]
RLNILDAEVDVLMKRQKSEGSQETARMLGDIFDTTATQSKAIDRLRTDTSTWIKELEKEVKKQKDVIQNLKGEMRRQKQSEAELRRSNELRFQEIAKEQGEQLVMIRHLMKKKWNSRRK